MSANRVHIAYVLGVRSKVLVPFGIPSLTPALLYPPLDSRSRDELRHIFSGPLDGPSNYRRSQPTAVHVLSTQHTVIDDRDIYGFEMQATSNRERVLQLGEQKGRGGNGREGGHDHGLFGFRCCTVSCFGMYSIEMATCVALLLGSVRHSAIGVERSSKQRLPT